VLEALRQPGLALEAGEQLRVLGLGRRQHLDGHHLAEVVDRLVDAGHPPPADPLEDLVLVEEQLAAVAAAQDADLVLGHVAVGHQPAGEVGQVRVRVLRLAQPALPQGADLLGAQQAAAGQRVAETLDGGLHERCLRKQVPVG
jgi:hypothetical protein